MKRKFFGLVSVCLALVMTLSMVSFVWAEPRMTPKMVTAEEPTCSNETVFLKGLILTSILEEETSLDVSDFSLTADEAEEVLLEVVNENPGSLSKLSGYSISDDESGLVIHFEYEEPTVFLFSTKAYSAEVEQEKRRILNCVEEGMSDVEKALVVHDYMALNYEYDTTYSIYSAEGMFENKTGVCQAYALAFKEIMEELDIPCQIVTSHAMNHAWNLVMIDGEWYHVDITWDDPIPDMLGRARHIFFLLSDDAISDAGYYMRPHHSWTAKNVADSDRYDGYFWYDVESAIITTQGNFYYIKYDYNESDYGRIIQRNVSSGRESVLYEIDTVWNVWNDSYGYWIGCYSGLGLYNGRLYFNTPERIKSVTLSGTNVKTVYTPNTSTGYLYGFAMNDTIITYGLATSPNDDLTNIGKCTISGTAVVYVSGVSLNQASAHLLIGESCTLQATVKPGDASNKKVYWSSSNTKVATVENGVVVAKDAGKAIITVETEDGGYAAYCRVTVTPDLRVMIEGDRVVAQGKYISLKATAYYEKDGEIIKTTDAIGWRSSNESVLTVSKGKVTGVGAGSAVITAYVIGTDIEASMEIEVVAPVTSLKFASSKMTAYVGNRFSLFYELNTVPSEHTDIIEWTSSNEAVARVNQYGVVTPLATGTAKITAKAVAGKKTATCTVTVAREPEGIMIEGDSAVAQGKTITLKAYAY